MTTFMIFYDCDGLTQVTLPPGLTVDAATHEDIATSTAKQRLYAKRFEDVVTALRQHRLTRDSILISRSTPVPLSMMTRGNEVRFGKNCSRIATVNKMERAVVASLAPAVHWVD